MTALLRYDAACQALAEAVSVDEVMLIHDKADAFRAAARVAKNKEPEIQFAEIRIRAEIRLGEIITEQKQTVGLNKGRAGLGRPPLGGAAGEPPKDERPTLAETGIDKKLSSRAQRLAAVPPEKREAMLGEWRERVKQENERVTVNLLKEGEKAERRAERQQAIEGGGTVDDLNDLVARGVTFATISADPAWDFETWSERGQDRSAIQHYQTQSLDEIKAMPVPQLAGKDAILHLWCLSSMLPQALEVIAAWGFEFKKVGFVWNKLNASGEGRHMGPGKWTRDEAELCLLATKGHPARLDAGVRQTFDAPIGEHSEKPEEFAQRMERLTAGPYLELYARRPRDGWTLWGNQVAWTPPPSDAAGTIVDHDEAGEVIDLPPLPRPQWKAAMAELTSVDIPDLPPELERGNPACTIGAKP